LPHRRPPLRGLSADAIGLGRVADTRDIAAADTRDAAFLAGKVPPPPRFP
jgi:3-(3-hydroxy-phenyl)propionate hydroxylase